jgi:hypothetical protein
VGFSLLTHAWWHHGGAWNAPLRVNSMCIMHFLVATSAK